MADASTAAEPDLVDGPPPPPPSGSVRGGLIFVAVIVAAMLIGYMFGNGVGSTSHQHGTAAGAHAHGAGGVDAAGLSSSVGGYALSVEPLTRAVGVAAPVRFTIRGPDGAPVTRYETVHDRALHLIVTRADLTGYQHIHPSLAADGTWSVPLTLSAPGTWRMYADFATVTPTGQPFAATLGAVLSVPGDFTPAALPAPSGSATVDGFTVTREGAPKVGARSPLLVRVARDGRPVPNLERYLGAYGHLVVLRASDGAYLHVHPDEQLVGDAVRFWVDPPGPGAYRAFFDFSVGGTVRTAEFTIEV